MKKLVVGLLIILVVIGMFTGCTSQQMARNYGGSETIELDPGVKLENITWKDNDLWILTRPMYEGETAETHTFGESSSFGIFEGTITVVEKELD